MRRFPAVTALAIAIGIPPTPASGQTAASPPAAATAPRARVVPRIDTLHGEVRRDDYFWMREKTNPEVVAYLEAENAFVEAGTAHTKALQEQLYKEMLGRLKETDQAVPYRDGRWWYYTRTEQGKNYPIFARRQGSTEAMPASAPEHVVLDQNERALGKKFHALGGFDVSPDGNFLIWLEDTTAFRDYTLYVKDLRSGVVIDTIRFDPALPVWNGTAWADDNRTFFYLTADSARRGNAVWRHVVGRPKAQDEKVFQENDVLNNVSIWRSRSGRWVYIAADGFTSSEARVIPTDRPTTAPRVLAPRRPNVEYSVEDDGANFYFVTNDRARNFRITRAPAATPGVAQWRDWQAASDSVFVEGLSVFRRHAVVSERAGGLRRLRVVDLASGASHFITFPEPAYAVWPAQNPEFDTRSFRFVYSSLITPSSTYDYELVSRDRRLLKQQEIPSGHDPAKYEVRRLMATARDGARVPVSILMRRGTVQDASNPLLLYAYGSYGATMEPGFNTRVLSLVDRGFIYAIAHIRGGQEMGRQWYDDGKMLKKMNTFTDYIDVAEMLVKERYTSPERLVANGGSAGGLLMGAVANMRPELFRAVVADVPFVDVINTMLDASLPLTAQEWEQWGNPRNAEHYAYMKQYSPYDNVAPKAYPHMLVTTSFNDSQVMYWEPAKWVARLRATKTDNNPLWFKTNMGGGHGGSSGRYEQLREWAFRYAFMLDAVGMVPGALP